jgi:hypothetical protein
MSPYSRIELMSPSLSLLEQDDMADQPRGVKRKLDEEYPTFEEYASPKSPTLLFLFFAAN